MTFCTFIEVTILHITVLRTSSGVPPCPPIILVRPAFLTRTEKGEITSGSTGHAAGQCPSFIADYNMTKIHDYGVRLYPKLEEKTGQYVSWHGCGGIRFAFKPAEVEWFHNQQTVALARIVRRRREACVRVREAAAYSTH